MEPNYIIEGELEAESQGEVSNIPATNLQEVSNDASGVVVVKKDSKDLIKIDKVQEVGKFSIMKELKSWVVVLNL